MKSLHTFMNSAQNPFSLLFKLPNSCVWCPTMWQTAWLRLDLQGLDAQETSMLAHSSCYSYAANLLFKPSVKDGQYEMGWKDGVKELKARGLLVTEDKEKFRTTNKGRKCCVRCLRLKAAVICSDMWSCMESASGTLPTSILNKVSYQQKAGLAVITHAVEHKAHANLAKLIINDVYGPWRKS